MAPLSALLILASFAVAAPPDKGRLEDAAALSRAAADAPTDAQSKDAAAAALDGGPAHDDAVADDGTRRIKKGIPLQKPSRQAVAGKDAPPPPSKDEPRGKLAGGLVLAGAALLGGLQGWFSAGVLGAAAGAGLGLAAAWLYNKKDYGGAFGLTAGAIVGTALGGPIGGLIGAAIGGLLGHFLGKLFL